MNDFKLFDLLPNAVIVFTNAHVVYMNRHLLDILNINALEPQSAIEILLQTVDLKEEALLLEYFSSRDHFVHNRKIIQIEHNMFDEYSIFSFMLIRESTLKQEAQDKLPVLKSSNIDVKIAQFFKQKDLRQVKVLTFYKGLPLKNYAKIVRITDDSIELEVDRKHIVSLKENKQIFILLNESKSTPILVGEIFEHIKRVFTVKNFYMSKDEKHLREAIRIKESDQRLITIKEKRFVLYDLSINGISLYCSNEEEHEFLKVQKKLQVQFKEMLTLEVSYLKAVYEDDQLLKVIFTLFPTTKSIHVIKEYINTRQISIIREIHESIKYENV